MPTTSQTNLLSWVCKYYAESDKCLNTALVCGTDSQKLRNNLSLVYLLRKQISESDGIVTALELQNLYNRLQCFIELLVDGDVAGYNIENSEADCGCSGDNNNPVCCPGILFTMNGVSEKILVYADWQIFGDIPNIEVIAKTDGIYSLIPVNWIPDSMPNPSTITVTLPGIPDGDWYIRLSS